MDVININREVKGMKGGKQVEQDQVEVDWRSRVAAISEDPKKGARVSEPKELAGRRFFTQIDLGNLQADIPNLKAIMLDQSKNSWEAAKGIRRKLETPSGHQDPWEHESDSLDYLQQVGVAVVTAQIAIEEFANEYLEEKEKRERIQDKVKTLLPQKTRRPPPSQTGWWESFTKMVKARNEIVHPRGEGIDEQKAKRAWKELVGLVYPPHILAKEIIEYFAKDENKWLYGLLMNPHTRSSSKSHGHDDLAVSKVMKKINRNAPCPCSSGRKYKKCCMAR